MFKIYKNDEDINELTKNIENSDYDIGKQEALNKIKEIIIKLNEENDEEDDEEIEQKRKGRINTKRRTRKKTK